MTEELKTIWQDNEWKMYASEDGNNPNLPNALITIPEISTITSNPTYIKYANKQITDAHNAAQKKKKVKQHEPGYHRRMIAAFLTLFIGLVGLSISSTSVITGQSLTMAIIGLTISIPLFIAGLSLALATLKIQDKFNREKEQYKILIKLEKNIKTAQKEIEIKKQCIDQLINLLENSAKREHLNINTDKKIGFFGQIATNFDSKNDLNFYQNVLNTLTKLNGNKYFLSLKNNNEIILIESIIIVLIKYNLSSSYNNKNLDSIFSALSNKEQNLHSLINIINDQSINIRVNRNESKTFLFKSLGEILSNEGRLFALKDIASILNQHCQLNLNTDPKQAQHSLIKLAYEALNKVTDYQDVQTNIQLLLNNYQLNAKKIVTYFNTLFKKNYASLTDIFKEQDTTQLIENFEAFVTILENKAYFYQLIGIPLSFQVKDSYNFDSFPSYQANNYVKLNINNSNLYFKKIYQNEQQEGWNCGDVALGIERTWLVDELLKNSTDKKIRNLLSPEIKTAIMLAATYEEDSKIKEAELIDLLSLQNAKQDKNLSSFINTRINELLDNPDDSSYIKIDAEVRNIINTYIEAHENMKEAVKLCNNQLGKIEGKLLSLQDLDNFFANEINKQQHHDIYQAFKEKRESILKPKEDEINKYCKRRDVFEKYIKDYYGKNEWMVYHPDISGPDNTSIFDAIAYLKKIQIVICKTNKDNEIVIDYQTKKYGENINYILYNGQDHFIRLNVTSEQEYEIASNANQHVQPSAKSIAKHGFFPTKSSNSKQKSSDDTALREIIHPSLRQ